VKPEKKSILDIIALDEWQLLAVRKERTSISLVALCQLARLTNLSEKLPRIHGVNFFIQYLLQTVLTHVILVV
jgi:hypothetical protein